MTSAQLPGALPAKPGRITTIALYLFAFANLARTFARGMAQPDLQPRLAWSLGLQLIFLAFFTLIILSLLVRRWQIYLYFSLQSAIILGALGFTPELDFLTALFILLSYQAAVWLHGRDRQAWIGIFVLLTGVSSIAVVGPVRGLGLGLISIAVEIVLAATIITSQEVEQASLRSQALLQELQASHQRLEAYASQVEELASLEERNRLAREIHDSVSQILFSITLNTRAAQLLLEKDSAGVRAHLEQLQALVQSALAEMRSLITQLRQPPAA